MCFARAALPLLLLSLSTAVAEEIDFNRDIRPILSDRCFSCHGFDENSREAGLRLDEFAGATEDLGGYAAIVPGKPDESALVERIASDDEDLLMPPPDSHRKRLEPEQVDLLRRWIADGAKWGKHWAFQKPEKAPIESSENAVDFFVKRKLAARGLKLSRPAATHTLARRLSFDLTGLPPSEKQLQLLGEQPTEERWREYVDQLLDSPQFGERMAMWWLDGARYSDTDGFQQDAIRTNWPWRDWVVEAFNQNMPFDQFTIEQFAGDLLPDATPEQILATCFHRNHMNNGEGGRDPEESRVDYVIDRVNTSGTLWLGLTLGCVQCHDHKFDPVSQRDFYSLTAYFNSIDEDGKAGGGAKPYLKYRSKYAKRAIDEAEALLKESENALAEVRDRAARDADLWIADQVRKVKDGFHPWVTIRPTRLATKEGYSLSLQDDWIHSESSELPQDDFLITAPTIRLPRITGMRLEVSPDPSHTDGKYTHGESGEFILTNVKLQVRKNGTSQVRDIALVSAVADVNGKGVDTKYANVSGTLDDDPRTGWTTRTKPSDVPHQAVYALAEPLVLGDDEQLDIVLMHRSLDPRAVMGRFRLAFTDQGGAAVRSTGPMAMEELAEVVVKANDPESSDLVPDGLRKKLQTQFLADHLEYQRAKRRFDQVKRQRGDAQKAGGELNVAVLRQRNRTRKTHVLERGVWDQHGEEVFPAVLPAVLPRDAETVPGRLELAQWIVSDENPLTARVVTNHIWQLLFGAGLVRTPNDFGLQGESPTHPQLLDWLAVDWMESGWDIKHLIRSIVHSDTYRQSSDVQVELASTDPNNRLLARAPRYRLPSWMIRDAALASSGMLHVAIGGPPVFPYQPKGVWRDQFMGRFEYKSSVGPSQYRRTLYAFWRRTSAPTFLFDSAMRRTCEVIPRRTNTPLHALTLMNDTTSLEAARSLAEDAIRDSENDSARMRLMFYRVLSRQPSPRELSILIDRFESAEQFYRSDEVAASEFLQVGQLTSLPQKDSDRTRLAAGMLVASMILNLDEAITRE